MSCQKAHADLPVGINSTTVPVSIPSNEAVDLGCMQRAWQQKTREFWSQNVVTLANKLTARKSNYHLKHLQFSTCLEAKPHRSGLT